MTPNSLWCFFEFISIFQKPCRQNDICSAFTLAAVTSYHLHLHIKVIECLHITSSSSLNANILRTSGDIEKRSMAFFPILSDLTSETSMFLGWTFPLRLLLEENSHFCWTKKWNCWILRNACWKFGYFCTVIGRAVWCDTCKQNFAHLFSGSSFMLKILGLM